MDKTPGDGCVLLFKTFCFVLFVLKQIGIILAVEAVSASTVQYILLTILHKKSRGCNFIWQCRLSCTTGGGGDLELLGALIIEHTIAFYSSALILMVPSNSWFSVCWLVCSGEEA